MSKDYSNRCSGITDRYVGSAPPSGVFYWGNMKEESTGQQPSFSYTRNTETQMFDIIVSHADTVPLGTYAGALVTAAEAVAT